jgi:hypothetical protein
MAFELTDVSFGVKDTGPLSLFRVKMKAVEGLKSANSNSNSNSKKGDADKTTPIRKLHSWSKFRSCLPGETCILSGAYGQQVAKTRNSGNVFGGNSRL